MGQTMKYRLADGTEIETRVPTLHPDDDAASLALQELNDSDDLLDKIADRAAAENDPIKALGIKSRMTEIRRDKLNRFRAFLKLILVTKLSKEDVEGKVIPQCTDADIVTILRDCREGPGWRARWLSVQGFSPADVLGMAKSFTSDVQKALSESLNPQPVSNGQPPVATGVST